MSVASWPACEGANWSTFASGLSKLQLIKQTNEQHYKYNFFLSLENKKILYFY